MRKVLPYQNGPLLREIVKVGGIRGQEAIRELGEERERKRGAGERIITSTTQYMHSNNGYLV